MDFLSGFNNGGIPDSPPPDNSHRPRCRQLGRLAARGALGMARTGVSGSHGSGDFFIAFSTTCRAGAEKSQGRFCRAERLKDENLLSPAFAAAADAVEEAILNSIFKAVTVTGRDGNTVQELDLEKTLEIMRKYGRIN